MSLHGFEIHQPASIKEATQMLASFGEDGCLYGGGTELLLAMKHDVLRFRHLVDVKVLHDLKRIEKTGDTVKIGATASHYSLERSEVIRQHLPVFAEMESTIANIRVRTAGTIGGNLCFAEPHSDPAALEAEPWQLHPVVDVFRVLPVRPVASEYAMIGIEIDKNKTKMVRKYKVCDNLFAKKNIVLTFK